MDDVLFQYWPHTLLRFEVQVSEHCNLNCRNCMHYAPLADPEFLDVEEYERDIKRLSKLFCGEVEWIRLMGGEPLLNPELPEIMCLTRQYFPIGHIRIVTNGILLAKQSDRFFELCRDKKIEIMVTKYPLQLDYNEMQNYVESKDVPFEFYSGENRKPTMWRFPIDPRGDFNPDWNFYHCRGANGCLTLRHGKMYTCAPAAHAHHLKKFFDLDISCSERDGMNIYKAQSADEIMQYMTRPIPFCRYCDYGNRDDYEDDFSTSRKNRYEWISFTFSDEDYAYLQKRKVYIYGAGQWGQKILRCLRSAGIPVLKFIVTNETENPRRIDDVEVISIDAIGDFDVSNKATVILAISGNSKIEIQHMLYEKGFIDLIPIMHF